MFPGQGSDPCLLSWQAESLPLSHQRGPAVHFLKRTFIWLKWGSAVSCSPPAFHGGLQTLKLCCLDSVDAAHQAHVLQGLRSSSRDGSGGVRVVRRILNHWTTSTVPGCASFSDEMLEPAFAGRCWWSFCLQLAVADVKMQVVPTCVGGTQPAL